MWQPPQRILHERPEGGWPTAEEASRSRLFSSVPVGPVELASRTWVPAMVPWRASEEGFVTPEVLAWYERFARGRPGAIVVEATGVRDVPSGPLLRASDDRFESGLRELVLTVRRASEGQTRLFIQLIDFLAIKRRVSAEKFLGRFLVVSDRHREALGMPEATEREVRAALLALDDDALDDVLSRRELDDLRHGYRERVTDTHLPHVRDLPETLPPTFADAARRCERAGFDGVELHFAHAYTLASFLSRLNTRDDGWGGAREQRVRLPREVLRVTREAVGADFAVGCRLLAEECIEGGSDVSDAAHFSSELAREGLDFLSTSRGGKFEDAKQPKVGQAAYPYTGPSGYECMPTVRSDELGPFGRNVAATHAIRERLREEGLETPVVLVGGLCSFAQAEELLASGAADVIGAARQSLADPDWWLKMRLGRGDEVRRCKYTNYCEALDQRHVQVTCQLWDRVDLDAPDAVLTDDGRRRLTAPPWKEGAEKGV